MNRNYPKFSIGKLTITLFAELALERAAQKAEEFLSMHKNCKWGEITNEEKQQNDQIVSSKNKTNKKVLSAYVTEFHECIWIVTDFGKKQTTILLPHEYEIIFKK